MGVVLQCQVTFVRGLVHSLVRGWLKCRLKSQSSERKAKTPNHHRKAPSSKSCDLVKFNYHVYCRSDPGYQFVYFNEMNLAVKSQSSMRKAISPDILRLLTEVLTCALNFKHFVYYSNYVLLFHISVLSYKPNFNGLADA